MAALPVKHAFYLHTNGAKNTGQAANLKVRYLGDSYASDLPLTITEVGTTGQYLISGFGDTGVSSYYPDCKLYLSTVEQTSFGVRDLGDPSARFLDLITTTEQDVLSNIDMNSKLIKGLAAASNSGEAVRFEQAILTTGSQTKLGQLIFDSTGSVVPSITAPTGTGAPTASGHLTNKAYVDAQIASIEIVSAPVSVNKVIVIPELDVVTGRNYQDLENATLSFASPGTSNRCQVDVWGMGASASFLPITSGALRANVGYNGLGRHIRIAPEETSKSGVIRFEDCTVIFGNFGGAATARSYTSFEFYNCNIDYYQALTLTTATIENCRFRGSSTNAVTLGGACYVKSTTFNNAITDGGTGYRDYTDDFTDAPASDPT